MSQIQLPEAKAFSRPEGFHWEAPADALARWTGPASAASDGATVSILDVIGSDPFTGGGITASRVAGALRAIGQRDVTVQINSPGGDVFEGNSIYNLLRKHSGRVTVEVLGLAASAASIIAMAGDEIHMATGAMMMVHKPWGLVIGNDTDFLEAHAVFKSIGAGMIDIYQARTGRKRGEIAALMEGETWLTAEEAVREKFATAIDQDREPVKAMASAEFAVRKQLDAALAKAGLPRLERRRLLNDFEAGPPPAELSDTDVAQLVAAMKG